MSSSLLLKIWLKSSARRFRSHLSEHIVVLICATVLSSLALYMFSDFINEKLSVFKRSFQQEARLGFCYFLSLLCSLTLVQLIRKERLKKGQLHAGGAGVPLSFWSERMGEHKKVIRSFLWQRGLLITAVVGGGWALIIELIFKPQSLLWLSCHLLLTLVGGLLGGTLYQMSLRVPHSPSSWSPPSSLMQARLRWKLRLLLRLYPPSAALIISSAVAIVGMFFVALGGGHLLEIFGLCWVAGILSVVSLCLEEAEALRSGIYEKIAGTSHRSYLLSLWMVCGMVGGGLFLSTLCLLSLASFLTDQPWHPYLLKLSTVASLPSLLLPVMIFQIDPRKPALNVLLITLISLFLATGIMAHLITLIFIPVLIYVASFYQMNRYYRS